MIGIILILELKSSEILSLFAIIIFTTQNADLTNKKVGHRYLERRK